MKTPLIQYSSFVGQNILLKLENLQPSGSFKNRGIGNICRRFKEEGYDYFVSSSGGNAGLAVAYAGRKLGVKVTVIVPEGTLELMLEKIAAEGAKVIVHGKAWKEADERARKLAESDHLAYISPFDHPYIWEGHQTLVEELKEQCAKPDAIVLSVGGGGLLCGVVQGLHQVGWEDVPVIAAETKGADSLARSIKGGELTSLDRVDSVAKSLCAPRVADQAFEWTKKHPILSEVVSDQQAVKACLSFVKDHRMLVEPACGASLAVVYEKLSSIRDFDTIVIIVCGGCGVSCKQLEEWERSLNAIDF